MVAALSKKLFIRKRTKLSFITYRWRRFAAMFCRFTDGADSEDKDGNTLRYP